MDTEGGQGARHACYVTTAVTASSADPLLDHAWQRDPGAVPLAERMIAALNAKGEGPIATQVAAFEKFWPAEAYHQGYEKLHPDQPYVATVSKRRYDAFRAKFPELVR